MNRRICHELANEISRLVRQETAEGWSLAAPESIYRELVDLLPVEIRERIVEHVQSDLVKTEGCEAAGAFSFAATNLRSERT